nr:hypothetical protein [Tanacetum cinerariifolium]
MICDLTYIKGQDEEDDEDEVYKDVNIDLDGRVVQMDDVHTTQEFKDSRQDEEDDEDEVYKDVNIDLDGRVVQMDDVHTTQEFKDSRIESIFETTTQIDVQAPTTLAPLPLSAPTLTPSTIATITTTLEANFFEFMQTNQFARAISSIPGIVQRYIDQRMNEAVKTVNEQLEAEVLTRSSNSSKTSNVVAADLSEMELKKILIKKMEGNKSIHRSNKQRNLYKALVKACESNKIILDTYGDIITLKRRRDDDAEKDEEPFAGPDRGPRDEEKERSQKKPMQTTHEMAEPSHPEFEIGAADDQPIAEPSYHREWFSQQKKPPTLDPAPTYELMKGSCKSLVELELFLEEVYKTTTDQLDWINPEGQQYPHNLLKPLPLIPNSRGRRVILFDHFINNYLEYLHRGASSRKYTTSVTKKKAADYGHNKWIEDLVPQTMEYARDVYSKHRIIAVTELKIVKWHNYKHLDWITIRRDDDKLYKFKEGDFKRLHIQDIEDMRVEDLKLDVKSYRKKLNLTRLDTYRSDLKRKEAYTAYSNPRGFIYQNKDKQNRLMRINELHKFSDGMLTNVRTALDDRLKRIRMKYLPHTIWMKSDKERGVAMIQAIDKQLKMRRIMRSLERFVGGRLYEGDFRML